MIPFKSFLVFKKVDKEQWCKDKIVELESEFRLKLSPLEEKYRATIENREKELADLEESEKKIRKNQQDIDDLLKRTDDKKLELEQKNEELRTQIRIIEAKASPSNVWTEAFSLGFSKAWDMMVPVLYDGFGKVKEHIADSAKIETLKGLQPVLRGKNGINSEKN